jgi:hypothetical protein
MKRRQMSPWHVAGFITPPFLAAVAIWMQAGSDLESSSARPLVQLPTAPTTAPAAASARPRNAGISTASQALPDPRIASTLQDSGATFRKIRPVDGTDKIICGEVRESGRSYYRRFVWLAEAQLLATDDGGPQFESVARLCDGRVALGPA